MDRYPTTCTNNCKIQIIIIFVETFTMVESSWLRIRKLCSPSSLSLTCEVVRENMLIVTRRGGRGREE